MSEKTLISPEAQLDRKMNELIGKIVDGSATGEDCYKYQELSVRRSSLMRAPYAAVRRVVRDRK
jgi:hypothetical protein